MKHALVRTFMTSIAGFIILSCGLKDKSPTSSRNKDSATSNVSTSPAPTPTPGVGDPPSLPKTCAIKDAKVDIPGVLLSIEGDSCVSKYGQGGKFTTNIKVTADAPSFVCDETTSRSTPCSDSGGLGENPPKSKSKLESQVSIVNQNDGTIYCACDFGPPLHQPWKGTFSLPLGDHPLKFEWPGRWWGGGSDTGNKYGPEVAPGNYFVKLTLFLPGKTVEARLPFSIEK